MPERIPLPVIAGPTASGKTGLAIDLAKRCHGEVVSADSMQIYRDVSIGTARPSIEEMEGIPHHLMGFCPLDEKYSVARYVEDASVVIRDIAARGKQPILCGGTGLYIQSLVENLQFMPEDADPQLRERLLKRGREEGGEVLLAELAVIDPETASRLHPHDMGRIVRALEIYETTGVTMSEQLRRSRLKPSPYDYCLLVLDAHDRSFLYDRINRRTDIMLQQGLLDEAERVLCLSPDATAVQAIGYKELIPYFTHELSLEEAAENLKRQTRRYAKRQLSWFRRMRDVHFLYIDETDEKDVYHQAVQKIAEHYGWLPE